MSESGGSWSLTCNLALSFSSSFQCVPGVWHVNHTLPAKIGVSVQELATLPSLDVAAEHRIERMVMRVGENLFSFMQSFCGRDGSKLVVPMVDRWFKKFKERCIL
ncbi:hypothetical protein MLD38_018159 [Melastoma candidum]|uniref:Uncharacterized protein n=1 Tax=Melastoma candidum TaxID=119954 RepID=A0ACB9QUV3_9MYRT|nr:hypothetical protein MLD38_018159 [Melastoma candidum]